MEIFLNSFIYIKIYSNNNLNKTNGSISRDLTSINPIMPPTQMPNDLGFDGGYEVDK